MTAEKLARLSIPDRSAEVVRDRLLPLRALGVLGIMSTLAACASARPATPPRATPEHFPALPVERQRVQAHHVDTVVSAFLGPRSRVPGESVGGLIVIVRDVDRPESSLAHSHVELTRVGEHAPDTLIRTADERGVASFDSLSAGRWNLRVRRLGYQPVSLPIEISAHCRIRIEVYTGVEPTCDYGVACPLTTPRLRFTICAPE